MSYFDSAFKSSFKSINAILGSEWTLERSGTEYPLKGVFSIESSTEVGESDLILVDQPVFVVKTEDLPAEKIEMEDKVFRGSETYTVTNKSNDEATIKLFLSRI